MSASEDSDNPGLCHTRVFGKDVPPGQEKCATWSMRLGPGPLIVSSKPGWHTLFPHPSPASASASQPGTPSQIRPARSGSCPSPRQTATVAVARASFHARGRDMAGGVNAFTDLAGSHRGFIPDSPEIHPCLLGYRGHPYRGLDQTPLKEAQEDRWR